MSQISKWLKKTVENLIDPDKEERLQNLIKVLHYGLSTKREHFSLSDAIRDLDYKPRDLDIAKTKVYSTILARGWSDGKLTKEEQGTIQWVAERLELSESKAREHNLQFAREHFVRILAETMEKGELDSVEETKLREIAASLGFSLSQFTRAFFRDEGEAFLRNIFSAFIADGHISQSDWDCLLSTAKRFGITHQEMLDAIQPQAKRFVEHVLADAKEDGILSPEENEVLRWLIDNLALPLEYQSYVQKEVEQLRLLKEIAEGRLPSLIAPPGIEMRSGEIVHFYEDAIWRQVRFLKNGKRYDDHAGTLLLTDHRLVFSSTTKSQSIGYHKIVSHRGGHNLIEVQIEGKPEHKFLLGQPSPIPYAIFSTAIAMANQTKVAATNDAPTRHIPRAVRQRVWQRYGGRCAECGATDYLEFDHIIPVAKGGGNSDSNVQLLCRRCNLKKSDAI